MILRVVLLQSAERDLVELKSYLVKKFGSSQWRISYAHLKESIRNLAHFPQAGVVTDELQTLNLTQYRQVICGMNRLIYEVRQDVVYVHMIVDTRRDVSTLLMQRILRTQQVL
jgi:toxin ParE1/3/4